MSKVVDYYEHNFSRPIRKDGHKLYRGDIFTKYEDGKIEVERKNVITEETKPVIEEKKEEEFNEFDLNRDGKVDKKDKSLAGRVLRSKLNKKRKSKKR